VLAGGGVDGLTICSVSDAVEALKLLSPEYATVMVTDPALTAVPAQLTVEFEALTAKP
jgi:hypothetical protein